ncbi:hypothetical protein ONZ45_g12978 [Pleurotus djamor]|nr:hypothetical protein ONZ45_g12978 [Pleurotus djamor]
MLPNPRAFYVKSFSIKFAGTYRKEDVVLIDKLLAAFQKLETLLLQLNIVGESSPGPSIVTKTEGSEPILLHFPHLRYLQIYSMSNQNIEVVPFLHIHPELECIRLNFPLLSLESPSDLPFTGLKAFEADVFPAFLRNQPSSRANLTHLRVQADSTAFPRFPALETLSVTTFFEHSFEWMRRDVLPHAPDVKYLELFDTCTRYDLWGLEIPRLLEGTKITHLRIFVPYDSFWNTRKVREILGSECCPRTLQCIELQKSMSTTATRWYRGRDDAVVVDWKHPLVWGDQEAWLYDWETEKKVVECGQDDMAIKQFDW